jgi:hypothetical protein
MIIKIEYERSYISLNDIIVNLNFKNDEYFLTFVPEFELLIEVYRDDNTYCRIYNYYNYNKSGYGIYEFIIIYNDNRYNLAELNIYLRKYKLNKLMNHVNS